MKIKTGTIAWLVMGFLWSIFMGITFVSIGLGSLFPSLNKVAGPFVCPNGQMELHSQGYQVSPVESGSILTWYCVDGQSGAKTELNPFVINLYVGPIYGLLIFGVVFALWYFYSQWDPATASPETRKWVVWIRSGIVIAIVVGLTLLTSMPLFSLVAGSLGSNPLAPVATPNATATAITVTFDTLRSGKPSDFHSTEKPLANWNSIPIMPQATAGQVVGDRYKFDVSEATGTIESFYKDALKSSGWTLADSQWLGLKFTKGKDILLVTYAPASDLESWIVTLVFVP